MDQSEDVKVFKGVRALQLHACKEIACIQIDKDFFFHFSRCVGWHVCVCGGVFLSWECDWKDVNKCECELRRSHVES